MSEQPNRAALTAALEQERQRLLAVLPQFNEETWRRSTRDDGWSAHDIASHLADSIYALARIALGEISSGLPTNPETGHVDPHAYNEQRRQKNRDLPREKVLSRMSSAFEYARRAVDTVEDYDTRVAFGEHATKAFVLRRIVEHAAEHRAELEELRANAGT